MIYIFDSPGITKNQAIIMQMMALYNTSFPDIDEREEIEDIIDRVKGEITTDEPNTAMAIDTREGKVVGGMIIDWYPRTQSVHLTYIFVDELWRRQGIAKKLLTKEILEFVNFIDDNYNCKIKGVFIESKKPDVVSKDHFNAATRLTIFKKIGIKWVDIPYVQPALKKNKKKVRNLMLLYLPLYGESTELLDCKMIERFLTRLYKGLNIQDPESDHDFQLMKNHLNSSCDKFDHFKLKEIPTS